MSNLASILLIRAKYYLIGRDENWEERGDCKPCIFSLLQTGTLMKSLVLVGFALTFMDGFLGFWALKFYEDTNFSSLCAYNSCLKMLFASTPSLLMLEIYVMYFVRSNCHI